jgi:hypothetical protein
MAAAISLIIIVFLTITINRIATIALSHTGLSTDAAKFQARSAFTGSGFTTTETEAVMGHPVRRRIIFALMLMGNAGLVTAASTLVLAFALPKTTSSLFISIGIIIGGIALLTWFTKSKLVDRIISKIIDRVLRRYTDLDLRDYVAVLHLTGDYQITNLSIEEEDWISNKMLKESDLSHEGIVVLGIQRKNGPYIGSPSADTEIHAEDVLTVYGKAASFKELDSRRKGRRGDQEHKKAVLEHERDQEKEQQEDEKTSESAPESDS